MDSGDTTLAILAGGMATRLAGQPKGLLRIGGRAILDRLVDLSPAFAATILISPDPVPYAAWNLPSVPDIRPGNGAPGAVVSALLAAQTPWVVVVACDMPFVTLDAVKLLLDAREGRDCEAVVFETGDRLQPFPGLYRTAMAKIWQLRLPENPSFHEFIQLPPRGVRVPESALRAVDPEARTVVSLNTRDDCVRWGAAVDF